MMAPDFFGNIVQSVLDASRHSEGNNLIISLMLLMVAFFMFSHILADKKVHEAWRLVSDAFSRLNNALDQPLLFRRPAPDAPESRLHRILDRIVSFTRMRFAIGFGFGSCCFAVGTSVFALSLLNEDGTFLTRSFGGVYFLVLLVFAKALMLWGINGPKGFDR